MRVQGSNPAGTILRSAHGLVRDNSGVGTLRFAYRRDGMETGDQVTVEMSTDGGSPWTTRSHLRRIADSRTDGRSLSDRGSTTST